MVAMKALPTMRSMRIQLRAVEKKNLRAALSQLEAKGPAETATAIKSPKKPETIRAGQSYNIRLQLGESNNALLLPKGGFFQSTGGQWVFVVDPSGNEAIRRNVRLGKQNSRYYEVLEGLQPGEQVITSNYDSFGDAERIVLK